MAGIVYTNQRSKLSKKQREAREKLLKEQRAIKKDLEVSRRAAKHTFIDPILNRSSARSIPSLDTGGGNTSKRESPVYTGHAMIGIGQLHKSNAVPVFRTEDAMDIARMRR
jgi:hypothetical protein